MSVAQFKAMFKTVGWTDQNVTQLVTGEGISDFDELAKIDLARAVRICKVLRTGVGGNPGIAVTEKAKHNLFVCGLLAKQALWTSRTLDCNDIDIEDPYQFETALAQYKIEKDWDNAPGICCL